MQKPIYNLFSHTTDSTIIQYHTGVHYIRQKTPFAFPYICFLRSSDCHSFRKCLPCTARSVMGTIRSRKFLIGNDTKSKNSHRIDDFNTSRNDTARFWTSWTRWRLNGAKYPKPLRTNSSTASISSCLTLIWRREMLLPRSTDYFYSLWRCLKRFRAVLLIRLKSFH